MRAAVLTADHEFTVAEVPDPSPAEGELVLQVSSCGICGSDLKAYAMAPAGAILGHEFCGRVVAVGSGVDGWRVGQAATAMPLTACGRCARCLAGRPSHCERVELLGLGASSGGFAEYVRVAARSAFELPDEVAHRGALVEPLAVGLHAVSAGAVGPGARVLVLGGGNVGVAVATWARRLGAAEIVVSDPSASRRETAATFGATGMHDPAEGPPPTGFDVVFECVGGTGMIQRAIDATAPLGRVVVAGVCIEPDQVLPVTALMKEVELAFAIYYRPSEFAAARDLVTSGSFDADAMITGVVGLDEVGGAFDRLRSSTTERKILVAPE